MVPYTISESSITVLLGGIPKVVDKSHQNYKLVLEAIKRGADETEFSTLIDITKAITSYGKGSVEVRNGIVYYVGSELHNYAVIKLLQLMGDGFDIKPLTNFLNNLMKNPSYRAVQELYEFLEKGGIPITEDGHFIVYKKVRGDFKDIYSGTFNNSVGATCEMPRNTVNEDSAQTCSAGLHVCSYSYLPNFGSAPNNRIVACKVNPADVVSIPTDYNLSKMRVCKYEVIEDVTEKALRSDILRESPVYNQKPNTPIVKSVRKARPVGQYYYNGTLIATFASAKEAEEKTGFHATNITQVCRGNRFQTGNFNWKYL